MELIDGNKIAADLIAELKSQVAALPGRPPCLALVRVGDDPASVSYVKKKETASATIGITSRLIYPPVTITQDEALSPAAFPLQGRGEARRGRGRSTTVR